MICYRAASHASRDYTTKSFRSLISSPELYETRSLLNRTESCLYVCLGLVPYPIHNLRWFTLCRRPNRTLNKNKKLSDNLLVPITSPHSTPLRTNVVAVGSDIYEIGGLINGVPSSIVSVLDCRSNSWRQAPNMQVGKEDPFAIAMNGKIQGVKGDSPRCIQVFDPKTQTWEIVSESEEWESPDGVVMAWQMSSCCVIDNVLYFYRKGKFKWFDNKIRRWRILEGLEGLPKFFFNLNTSSQIQMVDFGGKMAILWDRHDPSSNCKGRVIWCAEISLERCNDEEIYGTVEWSDAVLQVPEAFAFEHVLAATV